MDWFDRVCCIVCDQVQVPSRVQYSLTKDKRLLSDNHENHDIKGAKTIRTIVLHRELSNTLENSI